MRLLMLGLDAAGKTSTYTLPEHASVLVYTALALPYINEQG